MKKLLIPITALFCAASLLSGCAHTERHEASTPGNATLGQQLDDLKKAYDSKAISKKEYKEEKKRLLKNY